MLQPAALSLLLVSLHPGTDGDLGEERAAIEPTKFRYRASSLVAGARATLTFYDRPICDYISSCPPGALLGFSSEFGARVARLLVELYTAPVPYFAGDVAVVEGINLGVGGLFGNERFRGGVTFVTGWATFIGGDARFLAAPWIGERGGRHGVELRVGMVWFGALHLGINYRWFMPALNRVEPGRPRDASRAPTHGRTPVRAKV